MVIFIILGGDWMNTKVVDMLNKQVANWNVLFVKLHNYHWFLTGNAFFTLHEKFEEYYDEAAVHIDELAERVLAIGGRPLATMKEYLQVASIEEGTGKESATEMVEILVADYSTFLTELKEGMAIAQEEEDEMTSDMLLGIHTELEKRIWMLQAFLG